MDYIIEIESISCKYDGGVTALDGFSLRVKEGESVAVAGANGAGKTTLLLAIAGAVKPAKGGRLAALGGAGLVFQNPDDMLFMPTVFDDAAFGLRNAGIRESYVTKAVNHALNSLGISHLANRPVSRLSGGEKRLAAMAAVMTMEPKILLFDEPTAFLDNKARRNITALINSMNHTKIIASHDFDFLSKTCSRAVLLRDGKLFADGSVSILNDEKLMEEAGC